MTHRLARCSLAVVLFGCSASSGAVDAGTDGGRIESCAEARAVVEASFPHGSCPFDCATNVACPDLGACFVCPYHVVCEDGVVHVQHSGIVCDIPDAAGPLVTTCEAAVSAASGGTGAIPYCMGRCDSGVACTDYGTCFACPYHVECVGGRVQIERTLLPCDAGPSPSDAGADAP